MVGCGFLLLFIYENWMWLVGDILFYCIVNIILMCFMLKKNF